MRKIRNEKVKQVRQDGGKVTTEDGRPYIPIPPRPEVPKQEPPPVVAQQPNDELLPLLSAQIQTMQAIASYGETVAAMVAEMAKPKPKKKFGCTVGRDGKGNINSVDIEER